MRWKSFWDGLNIRKYIVVVFLGCLAFSLWKDNSIDPTVKDLTLIAVSYYFGYSNGQPQDGAKKRSSKQQQE